VAIAADSPNPPKTSGVPAGAFHRVRDRLGADIVGGVLPEGAVMTIEDLERRTGASRSIVREATRVLVSLGMLRATQRVGVRVLPERDWNVFDPQLIRWRLRSDARALQLRELFELRLAVEPEAARLAASRRDPAQAAALLEAAYRLSGSDANGGHFLDADLDFHRLVLAASANTTFVRLGAVIDEALRERAIVDRAHTAPDDHDLRLHVAVARSIELADGDAAAAEMREIVARTHPS
jgi:DNA-binding FadR family transcriptional regulator